MERGQVACPLVRSSLGCGGFRGLGGVRSMAERDVIPVGGMRGLGSSEARGRRSQTVSQVSLSASGGQNGKHSAESLVSPGCVARVGLCIFSRIGAGSAECSCVDSGHVVPFGEAGCSSRGTSGRNRETER